MNVQELEGAELDAAVARIRFNDGCSNADYHPSTNWAQGGPIIECEGIATEVRKRGGWWADIGNGRVISTGATLLIAAMRAYVASKEPA